MDAGQLQHPSHLIAEQFVSARLQGRALPAYPGAVPSLIEAYHCQRAALQRWPDAVAGWKVARIAPAWQTQHRQDRLVGPVFAPNVHWAQPGSIIDCPVFDSGFAAVEAEVVIRLAEDAPAQRLHWSADEAAELVDRIHVGVEVASSPLATLNELGPAAVVSDFGNNWGVVIGAELPDWQALNEITARCFIEGVQVGEGTTRLREDVLAALAFALGQCAALGQPLRAGAVITTGAITGVHDILIGQQSRHVFDGLGEIQCRAVRAGAYVPAAGG